jgi:predicted esterase
MPEQPASAPASASASASASPISVETGPVEIEVPGFPPAYVLVPSPSKRPKPLVIVTHGAGGRPEPHCEFYAEFVKDRAFILCTRGRAMERHLPEPERGYFYDGHHELGKEVLAAIDAAEARWGDRLDHERAIFAGYSQGASMGLLFLHGKREFAARFSRALFVEGGSADWNVALSRQMREAGLTRVAIVCGQTSCKKTADQSLRYMEQGGLERLLRYAAGAGHTYGGPVAPHVEAAFAWLVEGDERFSPTER